MIATRQLAAIMFTNIVGYTRLLGQYLAKSLLLALIRIEIQISVKDNGPSIPTEIKGKIFQPFFTTKPTGQGTGLVLSLSYDIITQGHDGHLEVETEEGIGTRFIIEIPLTT